MKSRQYNLYEDQQTYHPGRYTSATLGTVNSFVPPGEDDSLVRASDFAGVGFDKGVFRSPHAKGPDVIEATMSLGSFGYQKERIGSTCKNVIIVFLVLIVVSGVAGAAFVAVESSGILEDDNNATDLTFTPTFTPTNDSGVNASASPTTSPTLNQTLSPSSSPTLSPSSNPTFAPSRNPTMSPSVSPTFAPSNRPTVAPTGNPTLSPINTPTVSPTSIGTENEEGFIPMTFSAGFLSLLSFSTLPDEKFVAYFSSIHYKFSPQSENIGIFECGALSTDCDPGILTDADFGSLCDTNPCQPLTRLTFNGFEVSLEDRGKLSEAISKCEELSESSCIELDGDNTLELICPEVFAPITITIVPTNQCTTE